MDEPTENDLEHAVSAAGLERALREHGDDVRAAARAAAGFQRRRVPVDDFTTEPAHVYVLPEPGGER